MNTNLGFGKKLGSIKVDTEETTPSPVEERRLDEVAAKHGFTSREPVQKLSRRKPAEPSANLNIRPPITVFNRFVEFCERNRMSYPEALKELMDRAGE